MNINPNYEPKTKTGYTLECTTSEAKLLRLVFAKLGRANLDMLGVGSKYSELAYQMYDVISDEVDV